MNREKDYNIGLDIGVGSVGWCVTDEENHILKRNNKHMWGSRIFNEANTAQERRGYRSSRRRIIRRKERINILQSLLIDDMEKEYPNFFQMLRESSLDSEEKKISSLIEGIKYNIFSDNELTDKKYYKRFPTIYHLRNYLVSTTDKADIRLVYLAIHHIIKYRGNFLYEGKFNNDSSEIDEKIDVIISFLKNKYEIELNVDKQKIVQVLIEKNTSKANKKDKLISYFDYDKTEKQIIVNIANAILGYSFDINKIFESEIEKNKISFSTEIENEEDIKQELQENDIVFESLNEIYSWFILQDILKGQAYISKAFIEKYEKYNEDLKELKYIYKTYYKNEYKNMFRKYDKDNYVAYNGKSSGKTYKKCNPDDFFKKIKNRIEKLPNNYTNKEKILRKLQDNDFLRKLNVTENGAIPHQLHQKELEKILENQSKYYKTLEENKDKILKLFYFRIPYFVGPLSKEPGEWSWVVRKNSEKIRPWNFSDVVDEDATAEKFIRRMTNKCTYILNEDVMPKQSILYSRFCVLNELNNIKINNKSLAKDTKKLIIEKLFKTRKKVTKKNLEDLLNKEGITVESIDGIQDDNNFMSNMASYYDMVKILGKVDENNIEQCEELIYWITVFEDKKILKRKIKMKYKDLSEEQVNKLVKLRYNGWSRLSKKLIIGLKSNDGENIIEKLENTHLNFMQIINEKEFGFDKQLEKLMPKVSGKVKYSDVADIPTSPANKRAIWQSICIVKEISKIMRKTPKNIYIEFARSEDFKKTMKDNRAKQLLKKYEEIEKQLKELKHYEPNVYKELKSHQNDKELTEKMYLYFIQNGKCLYSGKPLNIDDLNKYEVDHIMPQSYIKDDSIDNKALVIREENQRKKDSLLLEDTIINKQTEWWKSLLENGLISQAKFYRLIKRKMFETDNQRNKFVQRQLVETRQITKHVTNLLKNEFKSTEIFAIRADLSHEFREKYKIYKNRNVNNYHHAHDAYILSIIGNTIDLYWKGSEQFKYSEFVKKYTKDEKNKYEKNGMILGFINKRINISEIKKHFEYKDCFISRMLEEGTGKFYDETLYSPKEKNKLINLKISRDTSKYGGYSGEQKAYCTIFKYTNKNKEEFRLVGIPIQVSYEINMGKQSLENYIIETYLCDIEYSNFKVVKRKILMNQEYLDENNFPMRLCSDSEVRSNKELIVNHSIAELICFMNMDERKMRDEQKEELEAGYSKMFNYLIEKLNKEYKLFESIYLKIKECNSEFEKLEDEDKKTTINGLINLMETGQGNLKCLGLADRAGRKSGISFKTKSLLGITFVDKSITGMYERRYKLNGMENSSSK